MTGPSISSAYQTIETAYPALYDGLVCLPGAASIVVAADGGNGEVHRIAGSVPLVSQLVTLPNDSTIAFIAC
jgi:hypothetical protein